MKKRLDQILLDKELVENRSKARGLIIDGKVLVNDLKETKPGTLFDGSNIKIQIINNEKNFVSRAGEKLQKAIEVWDLNINDKICLDIGSSTGGFTDCCLRNGAKMIYAVDVGTNQLDWKIRNNPKVISMEKTNFRYVTIQNFNKGEIDFFCCDVSFISVSKILPALKNILVKPAIGVILIKPQFESNREIIKNGKVLGEKNHKQAIEKVFKYAIENNFSVVELDFSPILGSKKNNIEYICLLKQELNPEIKVSEDKINKVVKDSQDLLMKKEV
ncbi:TlyA family RNA methyltransferase [Spiroplasma alleghenense]|uniref:rRNA methyltransferase n=1 Tax=Spiroplasma alleghenense TaxID=216931 RepID=A0A345Z3J0_9MOLU|nr:TlyA family RNA methyltransferase [Spiroplasma alleghenense]AXK51169.1 rRNA methyltransferase [Spiroplasma alleghenense]